MASALGGGTRDLGARTRPLLTPVAGEPGCPTDARCETLGV